MKYVADYLKHVSVVNAKATHHVYSKKLKSFLAYREKNPGKLTRLYHAKYLTSLIEYGLGRANVKLHHSVLNSYWEWCLDCGLAFENPVGRAVLPPAIEKDKPIFTESEYQRLVANARTMKHHWWAEAIQVAWHTGLRIADIALMKWDQVDFEARLIRVTPQKTIRLGKKLELPIAAELELSLLELSLKTFRDQWVFPTMSGHYRYDQHLSLGHLFWHQAKRVGCKFTSFHGFRRSFVSRMINAGANPAVICALTGHSLKQVMTYAKVSMDTKREAIQIAERQTA